MILFSLRNLNLSFGSKVLFQNADLVLEDGEKVGLLGLNGKGKSSLFKILEESISADQSTPEFKFDKNKTFTLFHVPQELPPEIPQNEKVENLFWYFYPEAFKTHERLAIINETLETEPSPSTSLISEQAELIENLENLNMYSLHQSFLSYLKSLGVPYEAQLLGELSGGQRKKILLSLGLSTDRRLVLWDEPTNHLDIETIKQFEEELLDSQKAFILVTHDRYLLGKVTKRILQIRNKKILSFKGSYTDFLAGEAEKEEERLQTLTKLKNSFRREDAWMKQGIRARGTRSKKRVENFQAIRGKISTLKEQAKRDFFLHVSTTQKKSKQLLTAKELSFSYDDTPLIEEISFNIYRGDKIGIIGENGAGKTTLIKLLAQELKPTSGQLKYAPDVEIKLFSQMRKELPLELTPFEFLGDGTDQVIQSDGSPTHVISYLKKFLFDEAEIHRPIRTFSGGERNRLQLAFNLKNSADIWIFDEPTNDLDLETLVILERTLKSFKGSLILISHDRTFLKNVTNRLIYLEKEMPLEVFEGGYDQAEEYLDAIAMERALEKEAQKEMEKSFSSNSSSLKQTTSSNTESKPHSIKDLESKAAELEAKISKIDSVISNLNEHQDNAEMISKMGLLMTKKEQLEEDLLGIYEQIAR